MIAIARHADGCVVPVLAHPGAKRDSVLGERAGMLRIAVTSPPDKGKANIAIQSLLAEFLGCKTTQVTLLTGATSRRKRFLVAGIAEGELSQRLDVLSRESGQSSVTS
jgi:uncharacterized protein (TIGR00251 family)